MRTVRNIGAAIVLGLLVWVSPMDATGRGPVEYDCPSGCSCEVGEPEYYVVGIECPEDYAVYVCNDIADSCQTYCDDIAVWLAPAAKLTLVLRAR